MKLYISRSQKEAKGALGGSKGVSFHLSCRVELTLEENELITRYKLNDAELTSSATLSYLRIGDLVRGFNYEDLDIHIVLEKENAIRKACQNLKDHMNLLTDFSGEDIEEF